MSALDLKTRRAKAAAEIAAKKAKIEEVLMSETTEEIIATVVEASVEEDLGEKVGKVLNEAVIECNEMLKKHGYAVSVTLNFHSINEENNKES